MIDSKQRVHDAIQCCNRAIPSTWYYCCTLYVNAQPNARSTAVGAITYSQYDRRRTLGSRVHVRPGMFARMCVVWLPTEWVLCLVVRYWSAVTQLTIGVACGL